MPVGVSAYVALANLTLSSNTTSVTISGFSSAYRDIIVVVTGRPVTSSEARWRVQLNGSASQYFGIRVTGDGSGTSSQADAAGTTYWSHNYNPVNSTGSYVGVFKFLDANTSNKQKTMLVRDSGNYTTAFGGRWAAENSAISSINFQLVNDTWLSGSTFTVYGVSA